MWLARRRSDHEQSSAIDFLISRRSAASWRSASSERMTIKTAAAAMIKPTICESLGIVNTNTTLGVFGKVCSILT
jgi:hypothetical protein